MNFLLISIIILSSFINLVFAQQQDQGMHSSCKTQAYLATLSDKNMIGHTAEELYQNPYNISKGACLLSWIQGPHDYYKAFTLQITSNGSVLYNDRITFPGFFYPEEYDKLQISKIQAAIDSFRKALAVCACSKI